MTPPLDHHDQYALSGFHRAMRRLTRFDPKPLRAPSVVQRPSTVVRRVWGWVSKKKEQR